MHGLGVWVVLRRCQSLGHGTVPLTTDASHSTVIEHHSQLRRVGRGTGLHVRHLQRCAVQLASTACDATL
jgi:hypothetical protein